MISNCFAAIVALSSINIKHKGVVMKIVLLIATTLLSLTVWSQDAGTEPATLKSVMKSMQTNLKAITAQVEDTAKNAESEKLALQLIEITKASKQFLPDHIKELPADQQDAQTQDYLKRIDQVIELQQLLANAFHNNDNTTAVDLLNKLSAAKKDGHKAHK